MNIANSYENCKLIWKLQTHMKIAKIHVGTVDRNVRIANWYENCKLIWKLQTDMRIAKQFSHFGVWFLCGCLKFSYETQWEWKLVLEQNVLVRLRCGWQKLNKTIFRKTFLDSYLNTNSYADSVWFIFKAMIHLLSQKLCWPLFCQRVLRLGEWGGGNTSFWEGLVLVYRDGVGFSSHQVVM